MDSITIKAWVFDFDGVIIDTESALLAAYEEVHRAHGRNLDQEWLKQAAGMEFDFDPWKGFEPGVKRNELDRALQGKAEELYRALPPLPGIVELITELDAAGLPLGLASNGSRLHVIRHLTRLELLDRFDFIACREDVLSPKPSPDLYFRVIEHFGIRGEEAIAVEDSETGTRAATRAGLRVIAVPNRTTCAQKFAEATLVMPSLAGYNLAILMDLLRKKVAASCGEK